MFKLFGMKYDLQYQKAKVPKYKGNIVLCRCLQIIISCLLVSFLFFSSIFAAPTNTIYFYSPESNINNYVLLKSEFDRCLSHYGHFQFQPFSDRKTFENFITKRNDGVFLLSSWHYQELKGDFPIEPVFVGISNNKSTYREILYSNEDITSIDLLRNRSIASSGNEDYTKDVLIQMLGKERRNIIDSLKILTVPKKIDALMAVGFDLADCALTTEDSFGKLLIINPKRYKMLRQLASKDMLLQIIAVPKQFDGDIKLLLSIIEEMMLSTDGRRSLKMIGLDGWQKIGERERLMFEK